MKRLLVLVLAWTGCAHGSVVAESPADRARRVGVDRSSRFDPHACARVRRISTRNPAPRLSEYGPLRPERPRS